MCTQPFTFLTILRGSSGCLTHGCILMCACSFKLLIQSVSSLQMEINANRATKFSPTEQSIFRIFLPLDSPLRPLWFAKVSNKQGDLQYRGLRGEPSSNLILKFFSQPGIQKIVAACTSINLSGLGPDAHSRLAVKATLLQTSSYSDKTES